MPRKKWTDLDPSPGFPLEVLELADEIKADVMIATSETGPDPFLVQRMLERIERDGTVPTLGA